MVLPVRRLCLVVVLGCCLGVPAGTLWAQQESSPGDPEGTPPGAPPVAPPAEADPAKQWAEQAVGAYGEGRYADAFALFEQALRAKPQPKFLYNMARTKEKLGEFEAAVALLERYVELYRQQNAGAEPPNAAEVANLVRTFKQQAFEAMPTVTIETIPPGAQVLLGDEGSTLGSTPLVTHLKPGRYKLVLRLAEHTDHQSTLVVPEKGAVQLSVPLKSRVKRAALSFWCNVRGAQIAVDGRVVAVTPFSGQIDVAPGARQISLQRTGYEPLERVVEVPEDRVLHGRYVLKRTSSESSWRTYLGWPLLVLGSAAAGGGRVAAHFADEQYTGTPRFNELTFWQDTGYRGGGAAAGVGLALVIWDAVREGIPDDERVDGPAFESGVELRPLGGGEAGR